MGSYSSQDIPLSHINTNTFYLFQERREFLVPWIFVIVGYLLIELAHFIYLIIMQVKKIWKENILTLWNLNFVHFFAASLRSFNSNYIHHRLLQPMSYRNYLIFMNLTLKLLYHKWNISTVISSIQFLIPISVLLFTMRDFAVSSIQGWSSWCY